MNERLSLDLILEAKDTTEGMAGSFSEILVYKALNDNLKTKQNSVSALKSSV